MSPQRRVDKLHVPYKFGEHPPVRTLLDAPLRQKETVSADDLERTLKTLLKRQGEDHRQDWLETERWTDRIRDELGDPRTVGIPPVSVAIFQSTEPIYCDYNPGSFGDRRPNQSQWTTIRNDDPARYEPAVPNLYCPMIRLPGVYRVTIDYAFEVPCAAATDGQPNLIADISLMDFNYAGDYADSRPWPVWAYGSTTVARVADTINQVAIAPTGSWAAFVRIGIHATPTAYTSAARQTVTYMRLPVPYP